MSLARDLTAPVTRRGTKPCSFKMWADSLGPTEADAVYAALWRDKDDPLYWTTPQLHERLSAAGYLGSESTTYKHRDPKSCVSCRR